MKNLFIISVVLISISIILASCCCKKCCNKNSCKKQDMTEFKSISEIQKNNQGPCQTKLECEDKPMKVKGFVDNANVYFKSKISYDKFFLIDKETKSIIEVKAIAADNTAIFEKIKLAGDKEIHITGIAVGIDAATNGNCKRLLTLAIDNADNISF